MRFRYENEDVAVARSNTLRLVLHGIHDEI